MLDFKKFRYNNGRMADKSDAEMMQDMYDAITKADAWEFVKKDPGDGGFMFCEDNMIHKIESHMKHLGAHSGASFGCMMRMMQYIARKGEEEVKKEFFVE